MLNEQHRYLARSTAVRQIENAIDANEWEAVAQRAAVEHNWRLASRHEEAGMALARWSETAADSHPAAVALQLSAANVFGLPPSSANAVYRGYMRPVGTRQTSAWLQRQDKEVLDRHIATTGKANELIVRAMYENTQKELAEHGIKQVTLYRGMALPEGNDPEWVRKNGVGEITQFPLASWTSDKSLARDFARTAADHVNGPGTGFVLASTFPAARIVSTARTGLGTLGEYEFVVAGGPTEAMAEVVWGGDEDVGKSEIDKHYPGGQEHDQQAHAGGRSANPRLADLITREGGFSYRPVTARSPRTGYMVSTYEGRERQLPMPPDRIGLTEAIRVYRNDHADIVGRPRHYIGAWIENGVLYTDISVQVEGEAEAGALARAHKQMAYYDVRGRRTIYVGDDEANVARPTRGRDAGGGSRVRGSARGGSGAPEARSVRDVIAIVRSGRLYELAKHGTHDQKEHGNWAHGRSASDVPGPDGAPSKVEPRHPTPTLGASASEVGRAYTRIREFEGAHRNDPVESLMAVAEDGAVVVTLKQTGQIMNPEMGRFSNGITIPNTDGARMRGTVVTHNHPSGVGLSLSDIALMKHFGMAEIRAARRGDGEMRASLGEEGRLLSDTEFAESVRNIERSIHRQISPHVGSKISIEEANVAHQDLVMLNLADLRLITVSGVRRIPAAMLTAMGMKALPEITA